MALGNATTDVDVRGTTRSFGAKLRSLWGLFKRRGTDVAPDHEAEEFHDLFRHFVSATMGRRCLGLTFEGDDNVSMGANWVTVDLSEVERQARKSGITSLDAQNGYFDAVLCSGLERVSQPGPLIAEIKRVLDRCGELWIQVPLSAPSRPHEQLNQAGYWRFTPDRLRMLLPGFDEILCAVYQPSGVKSQSFSIFYGLRNDELDISDDEDSGSFAVA